MKIQSASFFVSILFSLVASDLHSQDEANKVIREYKEEIVEANKAYADSVERARRKKKQEIGEATQAALKALKAELAATGPGDIARAIELAKNIHQLDSTDKEAREILLAANIDLGDSGSSGVANSPPAKPGKAPTGQKAPAAAVPPVEESAPRPITPPQGNPSGFGVVGDNAATGSGNYPIQKNKRPLTLPESAYSAFGELDRWQVTEPSDFYFLNYGVDYGISDGVQIGFNHTFRLSNGIDINQAPFVLNSLLARKFDFGSSNLSAGIRASLPLYLEGRTLDHMRVSLPCRFNFADDKVAVWLGERPLRNSNEGILAFGITGDEFVALNLPVGMSFQLSEKLNLGLFTRLYRYYSYEGDPTHFTFNLGNYRPFNLLASYAIAPTSEIFLGFDYQGFVDAGFSNWSLSFGYIYRGF